MQLPAAPIIHARTKDVDFRANLLVVPDDFSQPDVQWARKYISDSTRYFELAGSDGRSVAFSNNAFVVTGISIRIGDLYRLCGKQPQYDKVDGNRTNYAFIGLVFHKDQIRNPFHISYSFYLDLFEKYMDLRWNDSNSPEALLHTRAAYKDITVSEAARVSNVLRTSTGVYPQVVDNNADTSESILAQATMLATQQPQFAFCSDIPMANCVLESHFTNVTSANAKSINNAFNSKATHLGKHPNGSPPKPASEKNNSTKKTDVDLIHDLVSEQRQHDQQKARNRNVIAACAIVGVSILALIIWQVIR